MKTKSKKKRIKYFSYQYNGCNMLNNESNPVNNVLLREFDKR